MDPAKSEALLAVLRRLRSDLGEHAFAIEDHWEGDLHAVGVARPNDRRYLVYITTWPDDSSLSFQCESPGLTSDAPYEPSAMVGGSTYQQLLTAVRAHLLGQ